MKSERKKGKPGLPGTPRSQTPLLQKTGESRMKKSKGKDKRAWQSFSRLTPKFAQLEPKEKRGRKRRRKKTENVIGGGRAV